jgi:DNA polymerase
MDAEREERLAEMGLSPAWRLRTPAQVPRSEAIDTDVAAAAESSGAATIAAPPSHHAKTDVDTNGNIATAHDDAARRQTIATLDWDPLIASIADCKACALCRTRKNTVPGVGSATAGWMFVGEAPGAEEDAQGEPFVGQAGRLLDNMLRAIGLERSKDVYIANVLKCRPPNNRNPEPGEVAKCSPYLERQLELIKPRLIVALGRFAAMTLLDTVASIASLRGRVHEYRGVPLIVTYHPAYLLRTLPEKAKAWEDLTFARRTFARLQNNEIPQP